MADAAPLIATADAPVPAGGSAEWFEGAGGARLRAALFVPPGMPRGSVVVSPGRTEPIEKYFEVVERLTGRGFTVLVHDWRGQGLSHRLLADRSLGHAAGHGDFLADYAALIGAFTARLPKPWIALGHSMGGCLTLLVLAGGEDRFSGAILSAPMLGLITGRTPAPFGRLMAAGLRRLGRGGAAIHGQQAAEPAFADNILTHDAGRYARALAQIAACPDLALGAPTWGWLDFAFSAMAVLERGAGVMAIAAPVTVVAAGEDALVDNAALRRVTARLPAGRFVEISGARHEILHETDTLQAPFWREFDDLAARVAPPAP
ncbi:MAG: alpha/beta fold hydrolase [Caulobacteraceae bacterium]